MTAPDTPYFNSERTIVLISQLEYVSGPRNITMKPRRTTSLINEILDVAKGSTIPLTSLLARRGPPGSLRYAGRSYPAKRGAFFRESRRPRLGMTITTRATLSRTAYLRGRSVVEARELRAWFNEHAPTSSSNRGYGANWGNWIVDGVLPAN